MEEITAPTEEITVPVEVIKKRRGRPCMTAEQKVVAVQKNRERSLLRIKTLYHTDPEYKIYHIEKCKAYYHRNKDSLKAHRDALKVVV